MYLISHTTQTSLLRVTDDWLENTHRPRAFVLDVFLDFDVFILLQSANVWHKISKFGMIFSLFGKHKEACVATMMGVLHYRNTELGWGLLSQFPPFRYFF